MIRKYNEDFIGQYDEKDYLKCLQTINYLDKLRNNYNHRYDSDYREFDGILNMFKESLDHYVLRKMEEDSNFINSRECDNYFGYLRKMNLDNQFDYYTNVVLFNVLNNSKYVNYKQKYIGVHENKYREKINKATLKINNIIKKIRNNQIVSQDELDLICGFVSDYREGTSLLREVIKYIFNNLTKKDSVLRCSPQIVSAILTYIPYSCSEIRKNGFIPSNVRMYVSNKGNGYDYNKVASSRGKMKQVIINGRKFSNISFKSMNASLSTYPANVPENDDFSLLMIVGFHEITHQYQSYMSRLGGNGVLNNSDFFKDGYPMAVKNILNEELKDYDENHDNDDIEIHATDIGWGMCSDFYRDILFDGKLKQELLHRCYKNKNGTRTRYSFAVKKDKKGNLVDAVKYNNDNLLRIMGDSRKREKYFKEMPSLKYVFSETGRFKFDILFIDNFGNTQMGASLFERLINTDGIDDKIRDVILKKGYNKDKIDVVALNIYNGINYATRRLYMLEYYTRHDFLDGFKVNRSFIQVADSILAQQVDTIRNGKRILNQVLGTYAYDDLISSRRRATLSYYKQIVDNVNKSNNLQNKGKK